VLIVVLVVVLAGVGFAVFRASGDSTTHVAIVGDSITVLQRTKLPRALGGAYRVDVRAENGRRIDEMLGPLQDALHRHPRDVVVNLGTNDALQAAPHPDWQTGFAYMMNLVAPIPCVMLVTVSTKMDRGPATETVARHINASLVRAAAEHPNLHLIDWDGALHALDGASLLGPDHIHPTPEGVKTLALLTRYALDTECRS
jgi:lysophospholipase L1-like esterase